MCLHGQADILLNAQAAEQIGDLERAADACRGDVFRFQARDRFTGERDCSTIGVIEPRQQVERGRFAGAVGTDQGMQRAVLYREIEALHGMDAAEALVEVARHQHRTFVLVRP